MKLTTVLIGGTAVAYGTYTAWARITKPSQFKKLQPMKDFWGERLGILIHALGYTVAPIIVGMVLICRGFDLI